MQFRKAAIVGVAAGLLGGLFGVGGGLIMVPGLIGVAKMERRRAHGTSLAATLPISLASLATYLAHGNVDWAVAFFITIGALVGARSEERRLGKACLKRLRSRWFMYH